MQLAKKWALEFIDTFEDQYGSERTYQPDKIKKWSEKTCLDFVIEHIDAMIAINGENDLWYAELKAIEELNLYERFELKRAWVKDRLKTYDEV